MILSFKANCAAVAASVLLLPAISASSAFAQMPSLLPPSTPEIPGVLLSQSNQVFGTVLERRDVPFSIASNAYDYQGSAGTPFNVCFRSSDVTVPGYLLPRYAAAGAAVGTCTNPVPFNLTGILSSLVVDRDPSPVVVLLDFYYQLINTSVSPPGSGADIFRLTVTPTNPGGFLPTDMLSVFYTKNLVGLGLNEGGPSLKAPYTADRDVTLGSVGFNFDFSHLPSFLNTNLGGLSDAPGNIDSGEVKRYKPPSFWLKRDASKLQFTSKMGDRKFKFLFFRKGSSVSLSSPDTVAQVACECKARKGVILYLIPTTNACLVWQRLPLHWLNHLFL